jgi:hypothetical protein
MRRRASILGCLAGAAILAISPGPICRVVDSARNFQRCFHDLRNGGASLNPIERVMFSLVLANTRAGAAELEAGVGQMPRVWRPHRH